MISIEKQKLKKDYSPRTWSTQEHRMLPCADIGCYTQWVIGSIHEAVSADLGCYTRQGYRLKVIIHINLYTVVKYMHPWLPMYSRWGMQNSPFFIQKGFVEKDFGLVWCSYSHACNDLRNADQCCHMLMTCAIVFLIAFAHDLLVEYLHHHSKLSILQKVIPGSTMMNTVKNGETLTGRLWWKNHSFFNDLPFYSNIPRMDDIAIPLQQALSESSYYFLLIVRIP